MIDLIVSLTITNDMISTVSTDVRLHDKVSSVAWTYLASHTELNWAAADHVVHIQNLKERQRLQGIWINLLLALQDLTSKGTKDGGKA